MQETTTQTNNSTAHPQDQVVGNPMYYGTGNNLNEYCSCCESPLLDPKMRVLIGLIIFFFAISMINFILGATIPGLILFGFSVVLLICLIEYVRRVSEAKQRASAMQTVNYNQVPQDAAVGVQNETRGHLAGQQYPPQRCTNPPHYSQPLPTQPNLSQSHLSQSHPSQPHLSQPHPSQPYPPLQHPQQSYATHRYPLTGHPSNEPPPSYSEVVSTTDFRINREIHE